MPHTSHSVRAPAKLNFNLHITGKRADGFHELDSIVAFAALADELHFATSDKLSLTVSGPFAGALVGDNLVLKAARALQAASSIHKGASISLTKNIPVGAGLGGGSSDAAAALRGLSALWDIHLDETKLQALAITLGSDVPACLYAKPARLQGIGEKISPFALPSDIPAVLVNPLKPLATPDVYRAYQPPFDAPLATRRGDFFSYLQSTRNALEPSAISLMPEIAEILSAISQTTGNRLARMSGSGATCFGLYETEKAATAGAKSLALAHPNWWCVATELKEFSQ